MGEASVAAPSRRKIWRYVVAGLGVIAVLVSAAGLFGQSDGRPRNCDKLLPEIIAMSRDDGRTGIESAGRVTQHLRTDDSLVCHASVRWQDGKSTEIEYSWELHSDGEAYIGYRGLLR